MSEEEQAYKEHLNTLIFKANKFADWIYHDVRLDCDDQAHERTSQRLQQINEQFGREAMFGIAGWWTMRAYWRLADAHKIQGIEKMPNLLPKNVDEILSSDDPPEKKRAFVSAQQFISTMTHDNSPMAEAIFNAAYEAGVEDFVSLMYSILVLSIRISNAAQKIRQG